MLNSNLKMFLSVIQYGGITEAANKKFISQPAVSQSIKNLEKTLNVKLFHRDKRNGLALTDVGEKIRLLALQMQHLEDQIYQTAYLENSFIGMNLSRVGHISLPT